MMNHDTTTDSVAHIDNVMTSRLPRGGASCELPDVIPRDVIVTPPKTKVKRKVKKSRPSSEYLDVVDDDAASVTSVGSLESLGSDHSRKKHKKKSHRKSKRPPCPVHVPEAIPPTEDDKRTDLKCSCKKKSRRTLSKRPDPEGGPLVSSQLTALSEYERILLDNEPLFSDVDDDDPVEQEIIRQQSDRLHRRLVQQEREGNLFAGAQLVNTNSSLKFAIIHTELQNIIVILKRVCIYM